MTQLNFDATTVDPQTSYEPIPKGWYTCQIVESEMKPTKAGDGAYIQLQLKVMEGQYTNRVVFDRLNIQNKNETAQDIAYKQLSAYCHATGQMQIQDSQQLHAIPFLASIGIEEDRTGQYDPQNSVKTVKALENAPNPATPSGGQSSEPAWAGQDNAPAGGNKPAQGMPETPPWAE